MHTQQRNWVELIQRTFPDYFVNKRVLEIGSVNINGGCREYFVDCDYTGIDVAPGLGVDTVAIAHEFTAAPFDVVFSTSALEHDMYWAQTLKQMVALSTGLMFFSCGSLWPEHGTLAYQPNNSLTVGISPEWATYYKNITPHDVTSVLDLNALFIDWTLHLDSAMDLTFWGLKR